MTGPNFNPGIQKRNVTTQRTDNYYRVKGPELRTPSTSKVDRLLSALEPFAGTVERIAEAKHKQQLETEAGKVEELLLSQTIEDTKKQRNEGLLPSMDPVSEKMLSRGLGGKAAKQWEMDIVNGLKEGSIDISTISNPEEYVDQSADSVLSSLGEDVHERGGFTSQALAGRARLLNILHNARSDYVVATAKGQVHSEILDTIDAGKTNGASLDEIIEGVRVLYPQANEAFNLNGKALDEVVLGVAESLAAQGDGDYELVDRLLNDDRDGIGPISGKRALSTRAINTLTTASKRQNDQAVKDAFSQEMDIRSLAADGRFTKEDAEAAKAQYPKVWKGREKTLMSYVSQSERARKAILREQAKIREKHKNLELSRLSKARTDEALSEAWRQGHYHSIPLTMEEIDENGKTQVRRQSALQERTLINYLEESKLYAQKNDESSEDTFNRELSFFVRNGVENPEWKGVLSSGWISASHPTTTPQGLAQNPNLVKSIVLYKELHAKAPHFLKKSLGGNTPAIEFYDTVRVFEKYSDDTTEDAIQKALDVTKDIDRFNSPTNKLSREAFNRFTEEIRDGSRGWLKYVGMGDKIKNMAHISNALGQLAEKYIYRGLSPEEAYTEAGIDIRAAHTEVNGNLIYSADHRIPQNFKSMAEDHIERFAKANNLDPDDLTIMSLGNSTLGWKIVHSRNMSTPGVSLNTPGLTFKLENLINVEKGLQAERKEELRQDINHTIQHNLTPEYNPQP